MEDIKTSEDIKRENALNFAKHMENEVKSVDEMRKKDKRTLLSTDSIQSALNDPYKNSNRLQQQSENMRVFNGTLKEIQFYKANVLTYDHYLLPIDTSKYKGKSDKFFKDLRRAAIELDKYQIKTLCPWVVESELRKGEIYLYGQDGAETKTFFKMPEDICKMTHVESFVTGYSIKLSGISEKTLGYFPNDIQKLWKKYKAGNLKNDKNFTDDYYKLDIKKAVAFSPEILESKGIPYYSGLLLDLSRIKDLSDLNMSNAESDNFKLIHQMIPSDDEGKISVEYNEALAYHQAVKNAVCDGIGVVSSPYKIDSITLQNNSAKNYDYLTNLRNELFNASGVDSSLFNSENRNNNQGVIYSANVDAMLSKNLLNRIAIWLNHDFKNNTILKNFRIVFVDSTIYDKEAKIASISSRLSTFDSKLEYLALKGLTPLEAINVLQLEDNVDFSNMMKPLANSHSQVLDSNNGRPSSSEESGDPNKVGEAEN